MDPIKRSAGMTVLPVFASPGSPVQPVPKVGTATQADGQDDSYRVYSRYFDLVHRQSSPRALATGRAEPSAVPTLQPLVAWNVVARDSFTMARVVERYLPAPKSAQKAAASAKPERFYPPIVRV